VKITTMPCPECGKTSEMEVDPDALRRWQQGELIQNAFPNMTPNERELLVTGTHPACWDKIFEGMDE
jgi:hypothetical protein